MKILPNKRAKQLGNNRRQGAGTLSENASEKENVHARVDKTVQEPESRKPLIFDALFHLSLSFSVCFVVSFQKTSYFFTFSLLSSKHYIK